MKLSAAVLTLFQIIC